MKKGWINNEVRHSASVGLSHDDMLDARRRIESLHEQGLTHFKHGQLADAVAQFTAILKHDPGNLASHVNLSNVYQCLGKYDLATQHLQQALRINPQHAEAYNNLGRLFYKQHLLTEAIAYFEKALRIHPEYWEAHYNLAHSFSKQNKSSRAIVHYLAVIRLKTGHPTAHYNLGLLYFEDSYFQEALEQLVLAVELDPENALAHYYLAHCFLSLGEIEQAMNTFDAALSLLVLQSDHPATQGEIHHNLAVLYLRQDQTDKALAHFKQALIFQPENDTAFHMVLSLQGNQSSIKAPKAYVADLFDQYADHYNQHMKDTLHYDVPNLLRSAVGRCLGQQLQSGRVLDVGCGTGLCGVYFRDLAQELIGIDLSPKMVEKSRALEAYDTLLVQDMMEYLQNPSLLPFDLIIAGDVLVYIGSLETLFQNIPAALLPSGRFAFTTEYTERDHFLLQPTGRFAHSPAYIADLARQNRLLVEWEEAIVPRQHEGRSVEGRLYIVKRSN